MLARHQTTSSEATVTRMGRDCLQARGAERVGRGAHRRTAYSYRIGGSFHVRSNRFLFYLTLKTEYFIEYLFESNKLVSNAVMIKEYALRARIATVEGTVLGVTLSAVAALPYLEQQTWIQALFFFCFSLAVVVLSVHSGLKIATDPTFQSDKNSVTLRFLNGLPPSPAYRMRSLQRSFAGAAKELRALGFTEDADLVEQCALDYRQQVFSEPPPSTA